MNESHFHSNDVTASNFTLEDLKFVKLEKVATRMQWGQQIMWSGILSDLSLGCSVDSPMWGRISTKDRESPKEAGSTFDTEEEKREEEMENGGSLWTEGICVTFIFLLEFPQFYPFCVYHAECAEVKRQLSGGGTHLPPCTFQKNQIQTVRLGGKCLLSPSHLVCLI